MIDDGHPACLIAWRMIFVLWWSGPWNGTCSPYGPWNDMRHPSLPWNYYIPFLGPWNDMWLYEPGYNLCRICFQYQESRGTKLWWSELGREYIVSNWVTRKDVRLVFRILQHSKRLLHTHAIISVRWDLHLPSKSIRVRDEIRPPRGLWTHFHYLRAIKWNQETINFLYTYNI